jgi:ligand-binding sensor domain-containing protein
MSKSFSTTTETPILLNLILSEQFAKIILDTFVVGSQFGLCRLDTKTGLFQTYTSERENPWSLSSTSIMSLFKDKQGTVWAGTYFGGVNYINPERQTARYYYPSQNGLPHAVVGKFTEDKNGTIWLCTEGGGLASFDPKNGKFQSYPLKGSNLKEIYYDANAHCLWIGTHITYLIRFDISTKRETVYESLPGSKEMYFGRNIMSIVPFEKNLILGTTLGVIVFNTQSSKVHYLMDSELKNGVTSMIVDSNNRLWVGTENNWVMCYDFNQKTLSQYRYRETGNNNLSSNYINIIFEDSKKQIWIGTRGYGLNLYQPKTNDFRVFTKEKNGLLITI